MNTLCKKYQGSLLLYKPNKNAIQAEKVAQWLRAHIVFVEVPKLGSHHLVRQHTTTCNFIFKGIQCLQLPQAPKALETNQSLPIPSDIPPKLIDTTMLPQTFIRENETELHYRLTS